MGAYADLIRDIVEQRRAGQTSTLGRAAYGAGKGLGGVSGPGKMGEGSISAGLKHSLAMMLLGFVALTFFM